MTALSIVIPTFNTAHMTLECCRAALAALPEEGEVIVVDDASTDGTAELLRATLPAVQVVRLQTNQRFAAAANAGIAVARGRLVLLLNSDTVIEPGAVAAFLETFAHDARLGVAGARLLDADGTSQWSGGPTPTLLWLTVMVSGIARFRPRRRRAAGSGAVSWVSGAAMAFRRETWDDAGPLDESYRFYAQDLHFCMRAAAKGWGVRIVESARVVHDGGTTVRQWRGVAGLPHDPALLWLDLLQWGRAHHGRLWAIGARLLMIAAATARVIARRAYALLLRGEERQRARSATRAYATALQQLFVEREQPARERVGRVARLDEPPSGVTDRDRT